LGVLSNLERLSYPTLAPLRVEPIFPQTQSTHSIHPAEHDLAECGGRAANNSLDPAPFCRKHGFRYYDNICSRCAGQSNMSDTFSLDTFLAEVKDSCTNHAARKGYTANAGKDSGDVLAGMLSAIGVTKDHALGEIIAKVVEYKRAPRRVLLTKIAGWCWLAWKDTEE